MNKFVMLVTNISAFFDTAAAALPSTVTLEGFVYPAAIVNRPYIDKKTGQSMKMWMIEGTGTILERIPPEKFKLPEGQFRPFFVEVETTKRPTSRKDSTQLRYDNPDFTVMGKIDLPDELPPRGARKAA